MLGLYLDSECCKTEEQKAQSSVYCKKTGSDGSARTGTVANGSTRGAWSDEHWIISDGCTAY